MYRKENQNITLGMTSELSHKSSLNNTADHPRMMGRMQKPKFQFCACPVPGQFSSVTLVEEDMASASVLQQQLSFVSDSPNRKGMWCATPPSLSIHA